MARSILTLKPFPSSVIKGGNGSNPTLITSAYNDVKENIKPFKSYRTLKTRSAPKPIQGLLNTWT